MIIFVLLLLLYALISGLTLMALMSYPEHFPDPDDGPLTFGQRLIVPFTVPALAVVVFWTWLLTSNEFERADAAEFLQWLGRVARAAVSFR